MTIDQLIKDFTKLDKKERTEGINKVLDKLPADESSMPILKKLFDMHFDVIYEREPHLISTSLLQKRRENIHHWCTTKWPSKKQYKEAVHRTLKEFRGGL